MKKNITILAALAFAFAGSLKAQQYRINSGYQRYDGRVVQPYWQSVPDGNPYNNIRRCR